MFHINIEHVLVRLFKFTKKNLGVENTEFKFIAKSLKFFKNILNKKILNRLDLYEYSLKNFKSKNPDIDLKNLILKLLKIMNAAIVTTYNSIEKNQI